MKFLSLSMYSVTAILFCYAAISKATSGSSDECGNNRYDTCMNRYPVKDIYFPINKEELNSACGVYVPYVKCANDIDLDCIGWILNWRHDHYEAVKDLCNSSSVLYKTSVANLQCLKREWEKNKVNGIHKCLVYEKKTQEEISEHFNAGGESHSAVEYWVIKCPSGYIKTACFIKSFKTCGDAVSKLVIDTFKKYDFWVKEDHEHGCPRETALEAVERIKDLELDPERRFLLNYALELTDDK